MSKLALGLLTAVALWAQGLIGGLGGPSAEQAGARPSIGNPRSLDSIGNRVSVPRPIRRVDPDYTNEAKDCKIQGSVPVQITIGGVGLVSDLRVLRFLGFGLDEQAVAAVRQWTFEPVLLPSGSAPVRTTVEVNFRLREGRAALADACATYFSGVDMLEGNGVGKNEALAVPRIEAAAAMGLAEAQLRLAGLYEYGDAGVTLDNKHAENLYLECAKTGLVRCQAGLGRVLVADSLHRVEGMAWLELAADGGSGEAKELFTKELQHTPADQQAQARAMKKILLPK